jgi:hypothetical protein
MDTRTIKVRMPKLMATFSIAGPNIGNTINKRTNSIIIRKTLCRLFNLFTLRNNLS